MPLRSPSAQVVAMLFFGGGAYGLVAGIVWVVVFRAPPEPVRLMLAGVAGTLLTIPLTIVGFYFGSSLASGPKFAAQGRSPEAAE